MVLEDVSTLSYSVSSIRSVIKKRDYGMSSTTKDFLKPGSTELVIVRGKNEKKRRCTTIWLNKLASNLKDMLLKGILLCAFQSVL